MKLREVTALSFRNADLLPHDLVQEVRWVKNCVHEHLQVMAGGGVAVQVDRTRGLQHSPQLHQPGGHHRQVGQHVVVSEEHAEALHRLRHPLRPRLHDLKIGLRGSLVPPPGILKRLYLRGGAGAVLLLKQHVVVLVALEGRVQIHQIHRLILHVASKDVQVVAVVEGVVSGHTTHSLSIRLCPAWVLARASHRRLALARPTAGNSSMRPPLSQPGPA